MQSHLALLFHISKAKDPEWWPLLGSRLTSSAAVSPKDTEETGQPLHILFPNSPFPKSHLTTGRFSQSTYLQTLCDPPFKVIIATTLCNSSRLLFWVVAAAETQPLSPCPHLPALH